MARRKLQLSCGLSFLLKAKLLVHLVGQTLISRFWNNDVSFRYLFTYICKPACKHNQAQDADKSVQKWWIFAFQMP